MRPTGMKRREGGLLQGNLDFDRIVYECVRCRRSYAPLDEELGLRPHERLSRDVVELVAWKCARMSYGEVLKDLAKGNGLKVSRGEVARIANEEGSRMVEVIEEREMRWAAAVNGKEKVEPPEIACRELVMEADAASVLTVAGEEHKMVWCARGFDLSARGRKEESNRPFVTQSRYASGAGSLDDFKTSFKALANRLGARGAETILFLGDGAECLWGLVKETLPGAVHIQDFWHVFEHLSQLAKDLGGEQSKATASRWCEWLRASRVGDLIEELRGLLRSHRGKKRRRIKEEIGYLEKGKERMDYALYEARGWPIGSGAVEGTCKHLVKERFGITGAHWRRANIKNVLALRQAQFNEEWDECWNKAWNRREVA